MSGMNALYTLRNVSVLMIAGGILTGCLDDKHDRITKFEPGVYLGKPDTELSAKQTDTLVRRAKLQGGVVQVTGGGGILAAPSRSSSVRIPSNSAAFFDKLNSRTTHQKGP